MKLRRKKKQTKGMVDISRKNITRRTAAASGTIQMNSETFSELMKHGSPKGDVFETARIAGIMAAKAAPTLIPMCHPLELSRAAVSFKPDAKNYSVTVRAEVSCLGRTGVEMEALTAAAAAALTIYDMMKWKDKAMVISDLKLLSKTGGKSGGFQRQ